MNKSTPFDLWRYSDEFLRAGQIVKRSIATQVSMPALFLFGQSIELVLKAFLLGRGIPMTELKRSYGHDLSRLLKEARQRKMGIEVKLEKIDLGVISLLGYEYLRKRYQYSQKELGETMFVPRPDETEAAVVKLVRGLRNFCEKKSIEE